jgi:hypothetical protein
MSFTDKALSLAGTASTMFANFWPWLLGAFLLGGVMSGYGTFQITRAVYQRATLKAELNLSKFEATLASNAVTAEATAAQRVADATTAQQRRDEAITALVLSIPGRVAARLQPDFERFRSAINADPLLSECLDRALPPDALGVLRRPGGPIVTEGH